MVQALNTGHDGSLCTVHANGPAQAVARLETLMLLADSGLPLPAVRSQIGACIDAVVYVVRGADRSRRVVEVAEVTGDHIVVQYRDGQTDLEAMNTALAGNEALVPVGDDAYVSRVAPRLQRYVLRDGVWTSTTADLTETRYGATTESRVEGLSDGVQRVQRWLLDRITFSGGGGWLLISTNSFWTSSA